jgi:hypothetical protein
MAMIAMTQSNSTKLKAAPFRLPAAVVFCFV